MIAILLMVGTPVATAFAFQAQGSAAKACSLLTGDLVEPLTANKSVLDLIPPEAEAMRSGGAACQWRSVRLQLWPPKTGAPRASPGKEYQTVPGAGELAYFRSNRDATRSPNPERCRT